MNYGKNVPCFANIFAGKMRICLNKLFINMNLWIFLLFPEGCFSDLMEQSNEWLSIPIQ